MISHNYKKSGNNTKVLPSPGLFLLPGGYTLEPDPSRKVDGALVATVGDWRLFQDPAYAPGVYRDGICTQYQGVDYTACMWYERETDSHPVEVWSRVGNGTFSKVADWPYDSGFCWYNQGQLVGLVRDQGGATTTYATWDGSEWTSHTVANEIGTGWWTCWIKDVFDPTVQEGHEFSLDGSSVCCRLIEEFTMMKPFSDWDWSNTCYFPIHTWTVSFDSFSSQPAFDDDNGYAFENETHVYSTPYLEDRVDGWKWRVQDDSPVWTYPPGGVVSYLWGRTTRADVTLSVTTVEHYAEERPGSDSTPYFEDYPHFVDTDQLVSPIPAGSVSSIPGYATWGQIDEYYEQNSYSCYPTWDDAVYRRSRVGRLAGHRHWVRSAAAGIVTRADVEWNGPGVYFDGGEYVKHNPYHEDNFQRTYTHSIGNGAIEEPYLFVCSTVTLGKTCLVLGISIDGAYGTYENDPPPITDWAEYQHGLYGYDGNSVTNLSSLLSHCYGELNTHIPEAAVWRNIEPANDIRFLPFPTTRGV